MRARLAFKMASIALTFAFTVTTAFSAQPKLEVVAEWTRLAYDLNDPVAEKAYLDQKVYKKTLLHGVKLD